METLDTAEVVRRAEQIARRDGTSDSQERWELVRELHRRHDEAILDAATAWCRSPEILLRCLGADVLGQLGYAKSYPFRDRSAPVLMSLLRDSDSGVTAAAVHALRFLEAGDTATICSLSLHESPAVRHAVACCLGGRSEAVAVDTLIRLASDSDVDVRDWATFGLGQLTDADTPAIRDALAGGLSDPDDDVRGEAMFGLATRSDPRAVEPILEELRRPDPMSLAIEAAKAFPQSRFVSALTALLQRAPDDADLAEALERCRAADDRPAGSGPAN
jgi:HEAT repeat protein